MFVDNDVFRAQRVASANVNVYYGISYSILIDYVELGKLSSTPCTRPS